jgi:acetylornithine/succinyldiaminopimelate/putrescine aminotransferase/predicted amino acid dehydrogenase/acyl-coenzyme A synthetase/AMP-(fatty) acid ligase
MEFVIQFNAPPETVPFRAMTLREIIFREFPHRPKDAVVIRGHQEEKMIEISLQELRAIIGRLTIIARNKHLVEGDTVLLTSFFSSNELANALLFSAFACMGIRVFIPIYPEVNELMSWQQLTNFKAVIIPYREMLQQRGHEREKEVIHSISSFCNEQEIPCWDAFEDFSITSLLQLIKEGKLFPGEEPVFPANLSTEAEAVIFTTSGTSGSSKLVVYQQGAFSLSCQAWQQAGLFDPGFCGNAGFTPLFTHTIGIRDFVNALWTGNPACLLTGDYFLYKPEVAKYLLLQMKPGHITGGPALFNLLLDFFRQFPELKSGLKTMLKALISIGAPYNATTARQLKTALGLDLFNAFGTTETQMVLLNRDPGLTDSTQANLGVPLPGVSIGLSKTNKEGVYGLHIQGPYQSFYILGKPAGENYFSTGDLVRYDNTGKVWFEQREENDFLKDDFGVKIPVTMLRDYYPFLYEISSHIEWMPLDNKPGLAAIIYVKPSFRQYTSREIRETILSRNETLQATLQPFEFSHRHLDRFYLMKADVPLTRKGTVSRKEVIQVNEALITHLKNPYAAEKGIESVALNETSLLQRFSNPRQAALLEALKLDVHFEKGKKDFLYYHAKGKQVAVLDLVGGFGSGLLGHDHPAVKKAILGFLASGQPALNAQGSSYHYPSLLARELNKLFGQQTGKYFRVQFGNTGAEALEIALHHAEYAWWLNMEKRRDEQLQLYGSLAEINAEEIWRQNMIAVSGATAAVVVINNCFHGFTAGARSLLNSKKQRNYFTGLLRPIPLHINDQAENWLEQLEAFKNSQFVVLKKIVKEQDRYVVREERFSTIIASIIEPVRGEGGISETKTAVADELARQEFPLIADEIQCGLGRTGQLPACPNASYYLLGKSLGGGYEKISAVLIDDEHFKTSFPHYYTSTFANGELAACAALAAVEVIVKENYAETARLKGEAFLKMLHTVSEKYPDVIESIQGRGLMLGIHFNKKIGRSNSLLRILCENELLGYLLAGWFFYNKQIRVLPSLSKPDSVRLEPSVHISTQSMETFCLALEELCSLCRSGSMYPLLRYLMNDDPYLDQLGPNRPGQFPVEIEEPRAGAIQVGFIGNFTLPPKELMLIEPDLQQASGTGLRILFDKMQNLLEGKPVRLFSKHLMKGKIHFTFYILPFDTASLEVVHRWGKKRWYISRIQEAVNCLSREGAGHISLGAHTSILSGNGLYLAETAHSKILTGNTLTVASCLYHMEQYFERLIAADPGPITIAVTGANGNIGSGLAGCLADAKYHSARILLIGNNGKKLELLRKKNFSREQDVECSADLFLLRKADIIISCTNTNDPLLFPHHIDPGKKVFIIDIAVPGSVAEEVKQLKNVQFCAEASTVFLPDDPDMLISTHTPAGKVFCCAAEVMLAALYQVNFPLKGHIQPAAIKAMMELAVREGIFTKKEYATPV